MPYLKWGVREPFSSIPPSETGCHLPVLAASKPLTRPYSSSHARASLRSSSSGGLWLPKMGEAHHHPAVDGHASDSEADIDGYDRNKLDAGGKQPSDDEDDAFSYGSNNKVSQPHRDDVDYRKIEGEDLDRMTEVEVYENVRSLRTQHHDHAAFRPRVTSPSLVNNSAHKGDARLGINSVIRIGGKFNKGLKGLTVTGLPVEVTKKILQKPTGTDRPDSDGTDDGGDNRKTEIVDSSPDTGDTKAKSLKCVSSTAADVDSGQVSEKITWSRSQSPGEDGFTDTERSVRSPTKVQIDSARLPVVTTRSITGPRMRYEVITASENSQNRSARNGGVSRSDLTGQIETVAKAQGIDDEYDSNPRSTRNGKYPDADVQLYSWRPGLNGILHSNSVSLRRRSVDFLYAMDSGAPAKETVTQKRINFPNINRSLTMRKNYRLDHQLSSQVSCKGKRLQIEIDMRSIRLPPIFPYTSS